MLSYVPEAGVEITKPMLALPEDSRRVVGRRHQGIGSGVEDADICRAGLNKPMLLVAELPMPILPLPEFLAPARLMLI